MYGNLLKVYQFTFYVALIKTNLISNEIKYKMISH